MDSADQKIGHELRRITRTDRATHTLMSGKVVAGSIDTTAMTCSVLLTIDDNTDAGDDTNVQTDNVMLNCVSMNSNGFLLYPADNSDVIVGEIDGPGQYTLIKCSNLLKAVVLVGSSSVTVKDSLIQFNDGSLGGLVEIQKLKDNLKAVRDYIKNTLEPAINTGITGVGIGSSASGTTGAGDFTSALTGQDITFEDMENTKITQG